MKKSKAAFLLNCQELGENLYFWTFTFRDCLDLKDARRHWGNLNKLLRVHCGGMQGLRVFEMHESHGLHVHLVTTRLIRVERVRECIYRMKGVPFGRIHVLKAKPDIARYLGKYLSKERPKALKGWRLWAAIDASAYRHTRVADVIFNSLVSGTWRAAKQAFGWEGKADWWSKRATVERLCQLCIVYNCEIGEYPGGVWDASDAEFVAWFQHGLTWAIANTKAEVPF